MWANVAAKLNILKNNKEITITQLAKVAEMELPAMSNYLAQRQRSLPLDAMYRICKYFGVSIDNFLDAPLEDFSLESLRQKSEMQDTVRADINKVIDEIYSRLNPDQKVWFKVEIIRFINSLPKTI